jgi:hypothetical protein
MLALLPSVGAAAATLTLFAQCPPGGDSPVAGGCAVLRALFARAAHTALGFAASRHCRPCVCAVLPSESLLPNSGSDLVVRWKGSSRFPPGHEPHLDPASRSRSIQAF